MLSVQCPGGGVEQRGGGAVTEATVKPVVVLSVAGSTPSLDRLGLGVKVGFLAA